MRLPLLALAAFVCAAMPKTPDLSLDPMLREIESKMPDYDAVESTEIQVPSEQIALGLSTKAYKCWKLVLTGVHGKQVHGVMERLKALHDQIVDLKKDLSQDIVRYASSTATDPAMRQRIATLNASLKELLIAYNALVEEAERDNLIRPAVKSLFGGQPTLVPKLTDSDYTMMYEQKMPECPAPK